MDSRCLIVAAFLVGSTWAAESREHELINRDWRYHFGDEPAATTANFDDGTWSRINLPHSFSTPQFAATTAFPVGTGWYRKVLDLPAERIDGRRVSVEFEAAFQDAEVFVNGTSMGRHRGGYTGVTVPSLAKWSCAPTWWIPMVGP